MRKQNSAISTGALGLFIMQLGVTCLLPEHNVAAEGSQTVSDRRATVTLVPVRPRVGDVVRLPVTLRPIAGWKINTNSDISIRLFPPGSVDISKIQLKKSDAAIVTPLKVMFEIQFSLKSPSDVVIPGAITALICQLNGPECDPRTIPFSIRAQSP